MPADEIQTTPPSSAAATPSSPPVASDAITEQNGAVADKPAVPPSPQPTPIRGAPERRPYIADVFLVSLALLLAVEIAINPVRNHDLLMDLASGRDLLAGKYNPFSGQEPYSHTTDGGNWVNHSWLYDVGLYQLYQAGGISALSIARAILSVLLVFVLIRTGQAGANLWGPSLVAAIGILAVSPRLILLQPAMVSFLFLALTLYFLQRGGRYLYHALPVGNPDRVTWKNYWPILVLFIAWVNVDEWFFLGPVTVILYALGQAVQRGSSETEPQPGEVQALGIISAAGLAVCLINPFHLFAYTLPTQLGLSSTAHALGRDSTLRFLFISGFDLTYFRPSNISAAHLTFYLLVVLAGISFVVNHRSLRSWRLLLVVFFLALSVWHGRAIPFFAVVAAPILALNFQEAARRHTVLGFKRDPVGTMGRFFGSVLLLGLLVVGWPGWLQSRPHERHRFALANDLDPALEKTALRLRELREQGVLPGDTRGFHFSPEVGNALAFYAPEIKGFFDNRYGLFGNVAEDYVNVRRGLLSDPRKQYPDGLEDWRKILDRLAVDHLVLYSSIGEQLRNPLDWLVKEKANWVLLYQSGSAFVYGNAAKRPEYRKYQMNFEALAYASPENRAPAAGMAALPSQPPPWAPFTEPVASRDVDSDETYAHLLQFDASTPAYLRQNIQVWQSALAGAVVTNAAPPGMLAPTLVIPPLVVSKSFQDRWEQRQAGKGKPDYSLEDYVFSGMFGRHFLRDFDDGPTENLLLAIRAARRSLGEHSNDYRVHMDLGMAYFHMKLRTRERSWVDWMRWHDETKNSQTSQGTLMLRQLRHVQAVSALESALLYRKDLDIVHSRLADLYADAGIRTSQGALMRGFKDLELQHRQAELKYARSAGPRSFESAESFEERMTALAGVVEELEKKVGERRSEFDRLVKSITKVDQRALKALDMSLAGKALDILLESNDAAFGDQGTRLQLELGLMTGRIRDVHTWLTDIQEQVTSDKVPLTPEQLWRNRLGDFSYLWISTLLAAGSGDYARADQCLAKIGSTAGYNTGVSGEVMRMQVMLPLEKDQRPVPMTSETALAIVVAKSIIDAPLPISESWLDLPNFSPPRDLKRVFVSSADWTGLQPGTRLLLLGRAADACLVGRREEAHICFLRALLALEQGDCNHAEEMLLRADRAASVLAPDNAEQEAFRILLKKVKKK
jgi:hypothetical protein